MSYRGPGVPIYDLDLHRGSSFRSINAFPIRTQLIPPEALGQADAVAASARTDAALARQANIPVPVLRAIRAVESGSSPSAIRFEPHVFWRMRKRLSSGATGPQIRAALSASDLAAVPYTPGNSEWRTANGLEPCNLSRAASCVGSETNRAAFDRAFRQAPREAVAATSWGSYQVLGGHLLRIFGDDPQRSVQEFYANPEHMSERIFASWMSANPVASVLARSLDFSGFARRYNGCRDCTTYASRLQANYDRFAPEWREISARLGGLGDPQPWPRWAPWAIVGGIGVTTLGVVGAVTTVLVRRRRSR